MKKYDERNTIFSRISLIKGSLEYEDFYKKNPEYKDSDDRLRGIKFRYNLNKEDDFKNLFFPLITNNKLLIKSLYETVENFEKKDKQETPPSFSRNLKEITKYFGATDVGIVKLNEYLYYSHSGGLNQDFGLLNYSDEIKASHNTAIVFTIKMDKDMINRAPHFEELLATEEAYLEVAQTGARLSMYLKSLGYEAFFNNSEYYLSPLVPLAYEAGLGEIGMSNHLITLEHGDNVRLGAVFTDLVVDYDSPIDFGLDDFCKRCALCLMNCPSKAITHKERIVNGRKFYKFNDNLCFDMWTKSGTDCGICIQSCPFTQGVNIEKARKMKDNPSLMDEIMSEHFDKYDRRNYNNEELDIVTLGKKND